MYRTALTLCTLAVLSSCGVKGSLKLPNEEETVPRDPVPTIAPAVTPKPERAPLSPEGQLEELRQYRP